jgi:hypothetical protein
MARIFPAYLPHEENASNLEYKVLHALRLLPERAFTFWSKVFKEVSQHKDDLEVVFFVFDSTQNLPFSEVKKDDIVHDGIKNVWYPISQELAEYVENDSREFDAIIVDEERDFKPVWFEIPEEYSSRRFVSAYDESRNFIEHCDDFPWGIAMVSKKVLARNCLNTWAIAIHLSRCIGTEVSASESSPRGQSVTIRISPDLIIVLREKLADINTSKRYVACSRATTPLFEGMIASAH